MTTADAAERLRRAPRSARIVLVAASLLGCIMSPAGAHAALTSPSPAPSPTGPRAPAQAKTVTFGIGPADARKLDGRPFLTYLASPGARLTDHVALVNLATRNVTLNVYAVDAEIGTDGSFGYLARAEPRRDAAKWIIAMTPGHRPTITVRARSQVVLPVVITIPADASPGDHAAGVITSLTSKVISGNGEQVDFEQRVALRTFIRISGPLHPRLTIERLHARYHGTPDPIGSGSVTVTYRVHNTGNVRLGARQRVIISGLFGTRSPARPLADVPLLLPDSAVNVSVTLHGVRPQVSMRARVVLAPLMVPGDVDPGVPARITATSTFWAIPWTLIVIVAALLVCALVVWAWRRRRRRPPNERPSGRHRDQPVGPDDSGDDSHPSASPRPAGVRS